MSIKIGFPCNTIHLSSNKDKKPPNIQIEIDRVAVRYKELNITVLRPALDRLTFGFCPDKHFIKYAPGVTLEEVKAHIKKSLWHDGKVASEKTGLSHVTDVSFMKQPYVAYNVNLRYKPPSSTHSILIQIDPKGKSSKKAFMRFDMNPQHFSKKALGEFRAFIEDMLIIPGSSVVTYDEFLIWCPIYRADVCIDVLGARPAELEIRVMKGKKEAPQKSHIYKSKTGRTETVYTKVKKGKSSDEYIYDKRQEQIDLGEEPVYGDFLHSRYESRVQKTTFHKLANIKNRCNRVAIRALDTSKLHKMHYTNHLFIRHALARTLEKALELIPPPLQSKFKKSYEGNMRNIWNTQKIWGYWKEVIATSGLFPSM